MKIVVIFQFAQLQHQLEINHVMYQPTAKNLNKWNRSIMQCRVSVDQNCTTFYVGYEEGKESWTKANEGQKSTQWSKNIKKSDCTFKNLKYTRSLTPASFCGAVFTCAHFQKKAQICIVCNIHYISEGIPSLMFFFVY